MNLKQTVTARILELYTHNNKFKKGNRTITNSVKDEKGIQLAGTHFEWVEESFQSGAELAWSLY